MIDDPIGVEQFCRRYVEPMGEESDHIHIVAITDALQVTNRMHFAMMSMSLNADSYQVDHLGFGLHHCVSVSLPFLLLHVYLLVKFTRTEHLVTWQNLIAQQKSLQTRSAQ